MVPAACRDRRGEWIRVTVLVDESGLLERSTVEAEGTKSFHDLLLIRKAAQQWRFAPARVG